MPILTAAIPLLSKHMVTVSLLITWVRSLYASLFAIVIYHFSHFVANALNSFVPLTVPLHRFCKTSNQYLPLSLLPWGGLWVLWVKSHTSTLIIVSNSSSTCGPVIILCDMQVSNQVSLLFTSEHKTFTSFMSLLLQLTWIFGCHCLVNGFTIYPAASSPPLTFFSFTSSSQLLKS